MMNLLQVTGPVGIVLLLVAAVILVLTVWTVLRVSRRAGIGEPTFENCLNGILFWGCISAVLGLLGQFSGLWYALGAISKAEMINPRLVAQGLMESFSTTILGLLILLLSSVAWFALRSWARRVGNVRSA
jgi:hypothetical protein